MVQTTRKRKLVYNTYSSLLNQFILIASGFVLPKIFLQVYGSEVNGLVSSITQFVNFITFMELGIGAVVQSALYLPLAKHEGSKISMIMKSADKFLKFIARAFVVYIIALMIIYPILAKSDFDYFYVATLIIILSVSLFAQYYFGLVNQLLLLADQKAYIINGLSIVCIIVNIGITVVMIEYFHASIHLAKLVSAVIFLMKPLFLYLYVKKNYRIDKKIKVIGEPIKQKWSGVVQHISSVVLSNTDTIILTLFMSLSYVSIYSIYYLVVSGVNNLLSSVTAGFQSLIGNMLAKSEHESLTQVFDQFEWIMHSLITILFTCTGVLIVPFVKVYTSGIQDINYIQPLFAVCLTIGQALFCLRTTYYCAIKAAGHYKETQMSALIEMIINIFVSVICVKHYGLVGVAIGTMCAIVYRTCYCVIYASKNILNRSLKKFLKQSGIDLAICILSLAIVMLIPMNVTSVISWLMYAVLIGIITLVMFLVVNIVFNKKQFVLFLKQKLKY